MLSISKYNRPIFLFILAWIMLANFSIYPLIIFFKSGHFVYPTLPEPLYWLIGGVFGLYTASASVEAINKPASNQPEMPVL